MSRRAADDSGFVLLIVLWAAVLLTLLVTQLAAAGRTELQVAANLRGATAAEAAADGAVYEAAFHALDPARAWAADGSERTVRLAGGTAIIRIDDEAARINVNMASPELLRALLRRVGADSRVADSVAAAIVDWRVTGSQGLPGGAKEPQYRAAGRGYGPPSAPFRSLAELGAVLGMTPELLAGLAPHVSVLADTETDLGAAGRLVRQAIQDVSGASQPVPRQPPRTITVTAKVTGNAGGRFIRRATMRLGITPKEPLLQVLTWEALAE